MKITARYPWATLEIWMWIDAISDTVGSAFTITSLYRPAWYNRLVGGVWNSYHTKAKAADLEPVDGQLGALAARARATLPANGQVVIEKDKGIVHIEMED